jgi:hypothetical protein
MYSRFLKAIGSDHTSMMWALGTFVLIVLMHVVAYAATYVAVKYT